MDTATLPKGERLSSKKDISRLLSKGKYGYAGCLRFCYVAGTGLEVSRIMVSVPKRIFKRAVKRNRLKRLIRENYRIRKGLLPSGMDVMFSYIDKEVLDYQTVGAAVESALSQIAARVSR